MGSEGSCFWSQGETIKSQCLASIGNVKNQIRTKPEILAYSWTEPYKVSLSS